MKTFLVFLSLALALPPQAALANVKLNGKVFLKGSRDPLPWINVFILPYKFKTTTNPDGTFSLDQVPTGPAEFIINAPGFIRLEQKEEVTADQPELNFYLERENTLNYETTIESNENRDQIQKTISRKQAVSLPGSAADPIKAVQNLPGVNRTQGFGSQVIIQGSAPEDTRYSIDGHEIPLIFHFGGLSSVFNPELTESIDYLSAGYRPGHGRAMGGIINLNSRNLENQRLKGSAFVDIFNTGLELEGPIGEQSQFAGGVRISYIGQVLKAAAKKSDDFNLTVAPSYSDLDFIYQTPLSSRLKFKLLLMGSKDSLDFVANNPLGGDPALRGNFSNKISFYRLLPELEWTHSSISKSKFSTAIGRDFIDSEIGQDYFNLKTIALTTRLENQTDLSELLTLHSGFDHRLSWADLQFKLPAFYSEGGIFNPISSSTTKIADLKNVTSHLFGFFLDPTYKPSLSSKWTFYPGVRIDYFAPISEVKVGPRLGARYALTPSLSFLTAGGLYSQAPREQEYSSSYGNPSIKSPSAWHLKVAAEKDLSEEVSKGSKASSGVFGRWFQNLVIPDSNTIYSNNGKGRAFGFENSFEYQWGQWNFWTSYTLSRSTRSDPRHPEYLYQYDQTHFLTFIAGVNLPRNWRISTRYRYVTGPLDTVPVGAVGDLDHDVFIPIRGDLYNVRLNAFSMLDLRIDKRWLYDTWTLSLYLDIQNVLNRQNTEGLQFAYDYTTSETVKGLPILPTFGLKGEF